MSAVASLRLSTPFKSVMLTATTTQAHPVLQSQYFRSQQKSSGSPPPLLLLPPPRCVQERKMEEGTIIRERREKNERQWSPLPAAATIDKEAHNKKEYIHTPLKPPQYDDEEE